MAKTVEEVIKSQEPFISQQEELYTKEQVVEMLQEYGRDNAQEWLKNQLNNDPVYKQWYLRELVIQMRYCAPIYQADMGYEQFSKQMDWTQEVTTQTAQRMVQLISTGSADKERYPFSWEKKIDDNNIK